MAPRHAAHAGTTDHLNPIRADSPEPSICTALHTPMHKPGG
nr:MAG TPA: hypothetical protein [Caudoviricetes sp.]